MITALYAHIANRVEAMNNCGNGKNPEWFVKHRDVIRQLVKQFMPSGSGIDCGTIFVFEDSNPNKLVFNTSYHHMNESGMYDGWTEHQVVVTPSLGHGFELKITGRDRNQIKDYLSEVYNSALEQEITGVADGDEVKWSLRA